MARCKKNLNRVNRAWTLWCWPTPRWRCAPKGCVSGMNQWLKGHTISHSGISYHTIYINIIYIYVCIHYIITYIYASIIHIYIYIIIITHTYTVIFIYIHTFYDILNNDIWIENLSMMFMQKRARIASFENQIANGLPMSFNPWNV